MTQQQVGSAARATTAPGNDTTTTYKQHSPMYFAWARFASNKGAMVAGAILLVLIAMAVFAPLITKTDAVSQDFLTEALAFPSMAHWFGVDDLGRDFFSRIVYGARISLSIGFIAAGFSVVIGIPLGALAGYFGGRVDWFVMRI
ncbi:MAG: ABC transporter permease, partial [Alphaproteobacteria bacterium]